jgi:hypothetical protein
MAMGCVGVSDTRTDTHIILAHPQQGLHLLSTLISILAAFTVVVGNIYVSYAALVAMAKHLLYLVSTVSLSHLAEVVW